ncbi:MAG: hypothetical protein J5I93_30730 [Pirellulaceae bacterium]|nr:hypothetical protein [Pirellulaceae bacterium]
MNQIAATIADSALAGADPYATAMQSLVTAAQSRWTSLDSDQAVARRDRVVAETTAPQSRIGMDQLEISKFNQGIRPMSATMPPTSR